jgi:hypothetical protein
MTLRKRAARRKSDDRDAELIWRRVQSLLRTRRIRIPKSGYLLRTARGRLRIEPL